MASIRKLPSGKWQAQVERLGIRKSKSFPTKQAAKDWAARTEYLIDKEPDGPSPLFRDMLLRYGHEESPKKRGARWERIRLNRFADDPIAAHRLIDLQPKHFADWRDRRLRDVSAGTVQREMGLLGAVLTIARREWGLIERSPMSDVRRPTTPTPRDRLPTEAELEALAHSAGHDLTNSTARAFHAFLFACETAMRAGEIVGLTWDRINGRVAHLPMTKNGHARDVPLSSEAMALLDQLPKLEPVFGLDSKQLDALWRKVRDRAGVEGLTFHDSRRAGTVKLSKKLEPLELAKVTGHRDLSMILNVYYKADAEDLARKLD